MIYTIKATITFESQIQIQADSIEEAGEAVADVSLDQWIEWQVGEHAVPQAHIEED